MEKKSKKNNDSVKDCLFKMYVFMMTDKSDELYREKYQSFLNSYQELNGKQQSFVKREVLDVINTMNNEEKKKSI